MDSPLIRTILAGSALDEERRSTLWFETAASLRQGTDLPTTNDNVVTILRLSSDGSRGDRVRSIG